MPGELVYETSGCEVPAAAPAQPWARLSLREAGSCSATELGLVTPALAGRVWQRDSTPADDAKIILAWLRGNAITDHLGVDTDMLVQLFIEAAVSRRHGRYSCDGEFLATLAGAAEYVGSMASSQWDLTLHLAAEVVDATLAAIADSDPRWRYAIVAARDPESPAGRVRQRLLG